MDVSVAAAWPPCVIGKEPSSRTSFVIASTSSGLSCSSVLRGATGSASPRFRGRSPAPWDGRFLGGLAASSGAAARGIRGSRSWEHVFPVVPL